MRDSSAATRVIILTRHPEMPARRAGLEGCAARAVALRGSALYAEHLRVTDQVK
jgi:hypothetical protein